MKTLTPKQAWLRAAEWGSYVRAGDPGACMYGFDERGAVQSEEHRKAVLAEIAICKNSVQERPSLYARGDYAALEQLESYMQTAPSLQALEESR